MTEPESPAEYFAREYEEALRDITARSRATVAEAVKRAEARRRITVDPSGTATVSYADIDVKETAA